MLTAISGLNC